MACPISKGVASRSQSIVTDQPLIPIAVIELLAPQAIDEVRRCLARRLPALKDAPVTEARVCQYENTANGDFLIDRHPLFDNVWLVGGGSGHGFKHGPVVGECRRQSRRQYRGNRASL